MSTEKYFKALMLMNKLNYNRQIAEKIISILHQLILKKNHSENKKTIFRIFDTMLMKLYEMEDNVLKKKMEYLNSDTDLEIEVQKIEFSI